MFLGVPRAIHSSPGTQLDLIEFLNLLGIEFLSEPRIIEKPDRQGLKLSGTAWQQTQMAVVNLSLELDGALFDTGEENAAAAVLGEPACDDASPGGRLGQGQEEVTAGMAVGRREPGCTHGAQVGD